MTRTGESLDREQSKALAEEIRAKDKECWWNASQAVWHLYTLERMADGLFYVEGYAGMFDVPHAWLELDSVILDPTIALWEDELGPVSYRAVRRYSPREVEDREDENGEHLEMPFTDGLLWRVKRGSPSRLPTQRVLGRTK